MFIEKIEQNLVKLNFYISEEEVYLGDLVKVVATGKKGVLAQIIKLESPEGNQEYTSATSKILFTVEESGKLTGWQGNSPGTDFMVSKLEPKEVLAVTNTLNADNAVFSAPMACSPEAVVNIDCFQKPSVIVADKEEDKNAFMEFLAFNLANKGAKAVLVDVDEDFTDCEDALVLKAGKDVKLPFDLKGLETVYDKILEGVSPEVRAGVEKIFAEIEDYLSSEEVSFIPFKTFLDAVNEECEGSKSPELALLSNSLTKLYKKGIFADEASEIASLFRSFKKSNLIVFDLSAIDKDWKPLFVDAFVRLNSSKLKRKATLLLDIDRLEGAEDLVSQIFSKGIKSGVAPVVALEHKSDLVKPVLTKSANLFIFQKQDKSRLAFLKPYLSRISPSDMLVTGKMTNNVPMYVKSPVAEEFEQEIYISQEAAEPVAPKKAPPVQEVVTPQEVPAPVIAQEVAPVEEAEPEVSYEEEVPVHEEPVATEASYEEEPVVDEVYTEEVIEEEPVAYTEETQEPVTTYEEETYEEEPATSYKEETYTDESVEEAGAPAFYEDYEEEAPGEAYAEEAYEEKVPGEYSEEEVSDEYGQEYAEEVPAVTETYEEDEEEVEEYNETLPNLAELGQDTYEQDETQYEETEEEEYDYDSSEDFQDESALDYAVSSETESDEDFDYSSSEDFQDESVLDYAVLDETEEEPDSSEANAPEQEFSDEDLRQFMDYDDEPAEAVSEEEAGEEEYSYDEEEEYAEENYGSEYESEYKEEPEQESNDEFTDEDLHQFMDYDETVDKPVKKSAKKPAKKPMPAPTAQKLPVYDIPGEEGDVDTDLKEGDTVRHKKYGLGVINKVIGYSEKKLCSIQFEDVGRRLLDPKLAELEKIE